MTEATAEPIALLADLFPGSIIDNRTGQRPEGVPGGNVKLHIILSTREIAVGWQVGQEIGTWFAEATEEDTAAVDHRGGTIGHYTVQRAGGCSCGALLKKWNPYAGRPMTQVARAPRDSSFGLPQSYSR
jgi:hypothetical protein